MSRPPDALEASTTVGRHGTPTRMPRSLLRLATALLGLALLPAGARAQSDAAEEKKFASLAEEYLDLSCRLNPAWASSLGYRRYDAILDDFSSAAVAERLALAKKYLALFSEIDANRLGESARIDLSILVTDAERQLFTWGELKPHRRDPGLYNETLGTALLYLTLQADDSPLWPERLRAIAARAKEVPRLLDQARANLESPSPVLVRLAIDQNPGHVATFAEDLPRHFPKASPESRADLEAACAAAAQALRDYQKWLETDALAAAKGDWRLGSELWRKKLRFALETDLTPERILESAWESFRATREEMLAIAEPMHAAMFPDHRHDEAGEARIDVVVSEVIQRLSDRRPTRETLFAAVERAIAKAKGFIVWRDLLTLPPESDDFVVEETPGYLGASATAFFNPAPPFEKDAKKSYWISPVPVTGDPEKDRKTEESLLREYNDYGIQSLTIHEAFPGHYVQYWHAQNSPLASIYKKVYASGTFVEGWAVLAENTLFATGYALDDPANLLVHKKIFLRTPLNAILDQTMHTTAMSDAEVDAWATDLLTKKAFQEEAEARGKLRRAKVTSTQLSTYFVGFLELSALRDDYRKTKGADFTWREFNERLLSLGSIPPRDARRLLLGEPVEEAPR